MLSVCACSCVREEDTKQHAPGKVARKKHQKNTIRGIGQGGKRGFEKETIGVERHSTWLIDTPGVL
jgi:hypothetical protein